MTTGEPAAGAATGGVLITLRLEGFVVFLTAVAVYAWLGASWLMFVVLFLAPDLAMLGYLASPRVGAVLYNLVHIYALPLALAAFGLLAAQPVACALALIWIAHIGGDRALGYGLKYATRFGDTHLLRFGRR
jgi:hypothetical protein